MWHFYAYSRKSSAWLAQNLTLSDGSMRAVIGEKDLHVKFQASQAKKFEKLSMHPATAAFVEIPHH